jgi:hypothetical protein
MNLQEHLMPSAERELGAFMRAVSELFGAEHARRAANDWLDEFERAEFEPINTPSAKGRDFGAITIAAAGRLATWLNTDRTHPARCESDMDEIATPFRKSTK